MVIIVYADCNTNLISLHKICQYHVESFNIIKNVYSRIGVDQTVLQKYVSSSLMTKGLDWDMHIFCKF